MGRTIVSSPLDEPGLRLRDLEGAAQAHGAREAAEAALQQMKVRFRRRRGRRFLARDDEDVAAEEHPHRFGGDTRDVDDDFDGMRRFDDIECGMVFAGEGPLFRAERRGQIGEDLAEVIHQLTRLAGGKKRELEHGGHDRTALGSRLRARLRL